MWISQEESGIGFILWSRAADVRNAAEEVSLQQLNIDKGLLGFGSIPEGFIIVDEPKACIQITLALTIILIPLLAPMR